MIWFTQSYQVSDSFLYDLFMRYTAISAEAFPAKPHYAQLLTDLNQLRQEKQQLEKNKQRKVLKKQMKLFLQG